MSIQPPYMRLQLRARGTNGSAPSFSLRGNAHAAASKYVFLNLARGRFR